MKKTSLPKKKKQKTGKNSVKKEQVEKVPAEKDHSVEILHLDDRILEEYKEVNSKELEKISLKDFRLFIGDYRVSKVIGFGARSKVLMVHKGNNKFAMKVVKITSENMDEITNEKSVMQKINEINSPFLIKSYDFLQINSYVCFVMEYLPGTSLEAYMELFKNFSEDKVAFFAACILLAMEALHSVNIYHRDIGLRNLNLDEQGYVRLIDYGFSVCSSNSIYGTRVSVINNKLVDVEDFGRCVWELLTKEKLNQVPKITDIEARPKISKNAKLFLKALFECKHTPLNDQGKFLSSLKKHDFFKSIDWPKLAVKQMKSPYMMFIQPNGTCPISVWQEIDTTPEFSSSSLDDDYHRVSTRKDKAEEKSPMERARKSIE